MALKFRLKGLAETFIDCITCPECGCYDTEDTGFSTDHTRVTFEGIVVVVQCRSCSEIFVPVSQRNGVIDPNALKDAVAQDCKDSGEPLFDGIQSVRLNVEKLNAERRGMIH